MPRSNAGPALTLESPRIRFNWGYHDGAWTVEAGVALPWQSVRRDGSHPFDKVYEEGFRLGQRDAGEGMYRGNSTRAWVEREARYGRAFHALCGLTADGQ